MEMVIENYRIAPIQGTDAWRLCNFVVANEVYLKDYFPGTLRENLTPTLADLFAAKKEKQFLNREEYLFTVKENTDRSIVGLVYVKELFKKEGQGELAYCMGYAYTGKGLMTKIVQRVINWAFNMANLLVLQIIAHESNGASIRIAEKCNFRYVMVLAKEHRLANGQMEDMQLYELKKNDFTASV